MVTGRHVRIYDGKIDKRFYNSGWNYTCINSFGQGFSHKTCKSVQVDTPSTQTVHCVSLSLWVCVPACTLLDVWGCKSCQCTTWDCWDVITVCPLSPWQGYRQRVAFIVTQAPMENTIGDFWRMIWEQKSAAIVMLTELEEGGKVG